MAVAIGFHRPSTRAATAARSTTSSIVGDEANAGRACLRAPAAPRGQEEYRHGGAVEVPTSPIRCPAVMPGRRLHVVLVRPRRTGSERRGLARRPGPLGPAPAVAVSGGVAAGPIPGWS